MSQFIDQDSKDKQHKMKITILRHYKKKSNKMRSKAANLESGIRFKNIGFFYLNKNFFICWIFSKSGM